MAGQMREQEKERTANRIRILNDLKRLKKKKTSVGREQRGKEIVKTSSRKVFLLLSFLLLRRRYGLFVCLHCGAAGGPSPFISPSSCVVFFFLLTMGETQEEKKTVK